MNIFNPLLLILFAIELTSCHANSKANTEAIKLDSVCCDAEPPSPPPPAPFKLIKTEQLSFNYGGAITNFKISLSTGRLYNLNGKYLQTFSIYTQKDNRADSFYFALPIELNRYWQELTIIKDNTKFTVGYYDDVKKFKSLYSVYLGDAKLNKDRVFISNTDSIK